MLPGHLPRAFNTHYSFSHDWRLYQKSQETKQLGEGEPYALFVVSFVFGLKTTPRYTELLEKDKRVFEAWTPTLSISRAAIDGEDRRHFLAG